MMDSLKLMEYLETIGHGLTLEGKSLRIMRGKHLPSSLREKVILHKGLILSILKRDEQAKAAHFNIGISGTLYTRTVSRFSTVYLEANGDSWEAWRETYKPDRPSAISFKTIVPPSSFGAAIEESEKYFQYIERQKSEFHNIFKQMQYGGY